LITCRASLDQNRIENNFVQLDRTETQRGERSQLSKRAREIVTAGKDVARRKLRLFDFDGTQVPVGNTVGVRVSPIARASSRACARDQWVDACAAAALVAVISCAPTVPALPSQGGPNWVELQTEHFTVWTDAAPERTAKLVRLMERLRQVVLGIAFPDAATERRVLVVAFRNSDEAHAFIPQGFAAFTFSQTPLQQPVIVLPVDSLDTVAGRSTITHELVHAISHVVLTPQPHWFAEGLATYFETIRLDEEAGSLDVGVPRADRVRWLHRGRPLRIDALFGCRKLSCMDGQYYATAWALFAFLMNEHRQELLAYMRAMRDVRPESQTALWLQMFPQLAPNELDHALVRWLVAGRQTVLRFNVKFQEHEIARRDLGDADVLVARGVARTLFENHGPGPLVPELVDALARDPANLHARLVEKTKRGKISIDVARRIAAAHPDDWRAWWLVWTAGDADARARTCVLLARDPAPWMKTSCEPAAP
jgi:hypothetical protein